MVRVTRSRHQQKGMSAAGWLGVLAILGFFVVTFFRVFPMYYDHLKVQTALEGLKEDSSVDLASKRAVWNALSKRLHVQGMRNLQQNHVTLTKNKSGQYVVTVKYEVRADYIANLFIGARFNESTVISR